MPVYHAALAAAPELAVARAAVEEIAWTYEMRGEAPERAAVLTVPVVVHVVAPVPDAVTDEQVASQIAVLSADFRRANRDLPRAPDAFEELAGDAQVEFALATRAPNGAPTTGITRKASSVDDWGTDDAIKRARTGGRDPWPTDRYLNIWVCPLGDVLGYAQFPGMPAATDGVVVNWIAFGTTGTARAPFDRGRTATHEVGHWLNLRHIWGDDGEGCSGSDFVSDTPNQGGPRYGDPEFPALSCGNEPYGDMFCNFMDYVDDAAMVMFTQGQVDRMHAALDGPRASFG